MLMLVSYDVNTTTASGRRRLRRIAKGTVFAFKILSLSAHWIGLSGLHLRGNWNLFVSRRVIVCGIII